MDQWIKTDALEAVRRVYDEHLTAQYKNNPSERLHRLLGFEKGAPDRSDEKALTLAGGAYMKTIQTGGTELQASMAAGDALYGEFFREQFIRLEADPHLYRTDAQYHENLNEKAVVAVKEELKERSQQMATARASGPKPSFGLDSNQEQSKQQPQIPQGAALNPSEQLGPIVQSKHIHDDPKKVHGVQRLESAQHTQNDDAIGKRAEVHEAAKEILTRTDQDRRQAIRATESQPSETKKPEEKVDWNRFHIDPDYKRELTERAKQKGPRHGEQQQHKATSSRRLGR